jgi:ribosomal protein S18 acetylase RimI-like enzyme
MAGQIDQLYQLQEKDVPNAGAVLTDAFRHDPVWREVLAQATPDQKCGVFETPVRYCLKYGEVYATSEKLEGLITWVPGELADMTVWRLIRSGALRSMLKTGAQLPRRMEPVFKSLQIDRKEHMQGRAFLYLPIIGVASKYQGQGWGGRLLRALIVRSEQAEVPVYLETESESNVRWYAGFGFELIKQTKLPSINLPMWEMVRKPH